MDGLGRIFTETDPDVLRDYFRRKPKKMVSKVMTVKEAVSLLINDGDYLAVGGFGGVRIPTAVLHEIVRQGKKNLGFSGHTATHDCQILAAGKCFNRCDIAYVIGLEARGIPKMTRKYFESGAVECTEWTNAAMTWRLKAAAMGVSFIPVRDMLGTDTAKFSGAKEITCPFTGKKYLAVPALYPDVAIIHVHEADPLGNSDIKGILVSDVELARAAKKVIITCERLVPTEVFRNDPKKTTIPYYLVDAVIEVPFGSYPGNMPYEYYSDEEHLSEWLQAEEDPDTYQAFLEKYIFNTRSFEEYLELCGGMKKMQKLRQMEFLLNREGGK
ncbi:MAG: CoA transferase subunit A [Caldiserica bacterium]|jgi:glutaconate CoA-transferase subunit A|nr:CoA transferase subunit A [Caldisericota bacterium]MDH7561881.1 CoA-transferase [Caldisericota bacterium]